MTLHESIKAAVEQRMAQAQAATPGPWFAATDYPQMVATQRLAERRDVTDIPDDEVWLISTTLSNWPTEDAQFIAANDPARIIRDCRRDLKVLARHAPGNANYCSHHGSIRYPCDEIRDLAEDYSIPTEVAGGEGGT